MDAVTHPHRTVRAALAGWLEQRIDVSSEAEVARLLEVRAVPACLALDGEGRVLGRRQGFVEPADFVEWLESTRAHLRSSAAVLPTSSHSASASGSSPSRYGFQHASSAGR